RAWRGRSDRLLPAAGGGGNRTSLRRRTVKQIRAWAKGRRRRTGAWPTSKSGPVADAQGETWGGINLALRHGHRGLPGGVSLPGLLRSHGGGKASTGGKDRG